MPQTDNGGRAARLRRQVENAMRLARPRSEIEPLLERLIAAVDASIDDRAFACRHLAESCIERDPWRAALLLRRVTESHPNDEASHAMLGLCHALLGNYRCASARYRRALQISPRNPWYHHNIGHLLDVALGAHTQALHHLKLAHELEPFEDEITASLAHCLALTGRLEQALELAEEALATAPRNRDHQALVEWIRAGAAADASPHSIGARSVTRTRIAPLGEGPSASVEALLERGMRAAGFTALQLERARALWLDYRDRGSVRVQKPEVFAAAVEYAIRFVQGLDGVTRTEVARRYGVAAASVTNRWSQIRDALELRPGDPRYAAS